MFDYAGGDRLQADLFGKRQVKLYPD